MRIGEKHEIIVEAVPYLDRSDNDYPRAQADLVVRCSCGEVCLEKHPMEGIGNAKALLKELTEAVSRHYVQAMAVN